MVNEKLAQEDVVRLVGWLDQLLTLAEQIDAVSCLVPDGFNRARLAALKGTIQAALYHVKGLCESAGVSKLALVFEAMYQQDVNDAFQCPVCGVEKALFVNWEQMYARHGIAPDDVSLTDFVFQCDECRVIGTLVELVLMEHEK